MSREILRITQRSLCRCITGYLLLIPFITSLNGLLMHHSGGSSVLGPAFHVICSLFLICAGILHPAVNKNWLLIFALFAFAGATIGAQLMFGFSDQSLGDVGQLYKWYVPLLLFAVYYRWNYLRAPEGQEKLGRVFKQIPLIYSALIGLSAGSYLLFGFNPTLFPDGTLRFTGFSWGYNSTINVFFICGYVNYVLMPLGLWRKVGNAIGFTLLNSKTVVAYYALLGWSFLGPRIRTVRLWKKVVLVTIATPFLVGVVWLGYRQSLRAADASGDFALIGKEVDGEALRAALTRSRMAWYAFACEDIPTWPMANLLVGNGTNVDRRKLNPLWDDMIGSRWYRDAKLDKSNKAIELDMLGHIDMLGVVVAIAFALIFYIYPLVVVNLPHFFAYQILLIVLSMLGGHLINNPQTGVLLVFFYLYLAGRSHEINRLSRATNKNQPIT